ncbi:hypothetical protein BCR33DRAFT_778864 [Rhizoclosmatium globosum]|uniref:Uncharacterized protein n=1 Tax=Rhizoclosmatium globosum TaxID=329046 RepID=A0A1Y2D2E1_9FUNG|nr:hypothetical protein BCR33DRAFT_778864 [Rhizoclosmatium globosum]|eukprot:ORY53463.1 hypothetical protein BCR33DRAFT_778864 [Rhizoclosmatium globosum]
MKKTVTQLATPSSRNKAVLANEVKKSSSTSSGLLPMDTGAVVHNHRSASAHNLGNSETALRMCPGSPQKSMRIITAVAALAAASTGVVAVHPTATTVTVNYETTSLPPANAVTPVATLSAASWSAHKEKFTPFEAREDDLSESLKSIEVALVSDVVQTFQGANFFADGEANTPVLVLDFEGTVNSVDGVSNFVIYNPELFDTEKVFAYHGEDGASPVGVAFDIVSDVSDVFYAFKFVGSVFSGAGALHVDVIPLTDTATPMATFEIGLTFTPEAKRDSALSFLLLSATSRKFLSAITSTVVSTIDTTPSPTLSTAVFTTLSSTASSDTLTASFSTVSTVASTTQPYSAAKVTGIITPSSIPDEITKAAQGMPVRGLRSLGNDAESYARRLIPDIPAGIKLPDIISTIGTLSEVRLDYGASPVTFNGSVLLNLNGNQAIFSVQAPNENPTFPAPSNFIVYNTGLVDVQQIYYSGASLQESGFTLTFTVAKNVSNVWYGINVIGEGPYYAIHVDIYSQHQALGSLDISMLTAKPGNGKRAGPGVFANIYSASSRIAGSDAVETTVSPSSASIRFASTVSVSTAVSASPVQVRSSLGISTGATSVVSISLPTGVPAPTPTVAYVAPNAIKTTSKVASNNIYASTGERIVGSLISALSVFVLLA